MKKRKISPDQIGAFCFYLGLALEILIVILDKSRIRNDLEGQMFRVTFALFAVKIACTRYRLREWAAILAAGLVAGICYLFSTRDEAVRVVVFVASMKGIDYRKAMKVVFWGSAAGMALLALLSIAGILGTVFEVSEGFGVKEGSFRMCLGVGNSNALACMLWALMTLGIYLYHERFRLWHYGVLGAFSLLVYWATLCRTVVLVMLATVALAAVLSSVKELQSTMWVYMCGILMFLAGIAFSAYAAYISDWYSFMPKWVGTVDRLLTGRITSIYSFANGGGVMENWKLFGDPSYVEFFDMGYVRLFYWYGIIPGTLCVITLCLLLWQCRRQRDYMGFVLVLSFGLYTVIEAHAVSVYIARNYVLLLLGGFWTCMLGAESGKEAYFWNFYRLFERGKEA